MARMKRQPCKRGVASVEAVVVLPFLLLLFFAVTFVHDRYDAQQRAWMNARACAWAYSQNGCSGPIPAACAAQELPDHSPESPELDAATGQQTLTQNDALTNGVDDQIGETRSTLFGKYTTVSGSVTFQAGRLFGGKRVATAHYTLACNMKAQSLGDLVGVFWGVVRSQLP